MASNFNNGDSIDRKEMIHISLGSSSNAVTAHLLNLQGLSITPSNTDPYDSGDNNDDNYFCQPEITHSIDSKYGVWIPRVVIVDEPNNVTSQHQQQQQQKLIEAATNSNNSDNIFSWNGPVETIYPTTTTSVQQSSNEQQHLLSSFLETASTLAYSKYSRYRCSYYDESQLPQQRHVIWDEEDDEEEEEDDDNDYYDDGWGSSHYKNKNVFVDKKKQRWQQEQVPILEQQLSTFWESSLEATPKPMVASSAETSQGQGDQQEQQQQQQNSLLQNLSWIDYWMPPYSANNSIVALPTQLSSSSTRKQQDFNSTYNNDTSAYNSYRIGYEQEKIWKEDELWDNKIRHQLENCDSCQGFTIITEGNGYYSGLASWINQELYDECNGNKSTKRLTIHINDNNDINYNEAMEQQQEEQQKFRVRNDIQKGLALHGLCNNSNAVLPITLPFDNTNSNNNNLFVASSKVAMALETATLPYRLRNRSTSNSNSRIGVYHRSYNHNLIQKMSFNEYISSLQPSSRHQILELDAFLGNCDYENQKEDIRNMTNKYLNINDNIIYWWSTLLKEGTSIERYERMKRVQQQPQLQRQYQQQADSLPGLWMLNKQEHHHQQQLRLFSANSSTNDHNTNGILTSYSPQPKILNDYYYNSSHNFNYKDRSLHNHFAASTCLRSSSPLSNNNNNNDGDNHLSLEQQVDCLMEGMGIRYKPEAYSGMILQQNFDQLTSGGSSGGAGSYWKTVLQKSSSSLIQKQQQLDREQPTISIIGNTTRAYPYLYNISDYMKQLLSTSTSATSRSASSRSKQRGRRKNQSIRSTYTNARFRGLCNRDIIDGYLPELENCEEAKEFCIELKDYYEPPKGSGLVISSEDSDDSDY